MVASSGRRPTRKGQRWQVRTQIRRWSWHLDWPVDTIWPFISDTARFNEAAGLPQHEIEEIEQADGAMLFLASGRQGPFRLAWRELPVNWVANQWFEHCRVFSKGPLGLLCARLFLRPHEDGCEIEVEIEAGAANPVGWLLLRTVFFPATRKMYGRLIGDVAKHLAGQQPLPFGYDVPKPSAEAANRAAAMVERIEGTSHGHGLAQRLAALIFERREVDLNHLRPLRLAREWSVEPRFAPAPALRRLEVGEYCLFGPMSTPHIWLQLTLQPGEERSVSLDLPAGAYRLRTLERGPQVDVDHDPDHGGRAFPAIILGDATIETGPAQAAGEVLLANRGARVLTAIVEERRWARDALTADWTTSLQAFRDPFSGLGSAAGRRSLGPAHRLDVHRPERLDGAVRLLG